MEAITFENLPSAVAELQSDLQEIKELLLTSERPEPDHPLGVDGASAFIGKSKPTIYREVSKGDIPFHKQSGRLYFFKSELIAWLKSQ